MARRISPLLSGFPCQLHVYHGATALLVLQRLHEGGVGTIVRAESADKLSPTTCQGEQVSQTGSQEWAPTPLPYLPFLADYPSSHLLHLFPYELACRYQCVPVGSERKMLTLATCHWLNREIVAQLCTATRREIFQVRCEMTIIDEVLRYWQRVQEIASRDRVEIRADKRCRPSR